MLAQGLELEQLGAKEEQGVEQHDGGVGSQLFTVPQVLLLHPRVQVAWERAIPTLKTFQ